MLICVGWGGGGGAGTRRCCFVLAGRGWYEKMLICVGWGERWVWKDVDLCWLYVLVTLGCCTQIRSMTLMETVGSHLCRGMDSVLRCFLWLPRLCVTPAFRIHIPRVCPNSTQQDFFIFLRDCELIFFQNTSNLKAKSCPTWNFRKRQFEKPRFANKSSRKQMIHPCGTFWEHLGLSGAITGHLGSS